MGALDLLTLLKVSNQGLLTGDGEAIGRYTVTPQSPTPRQPECIRRWYAVYLHSRRETHVAKQLAVRQLEYFLPLYLAVHCWKNRTTQYLHLPLFPGYVFVRISREDRASILSVPGVVDLVGPPGKPIPLPDDELDALRLGVSERNPKPHTPLVQGERVRIRSGVLAGLKGTLQPDASGPRMVISLESIAQGASIAVDWEEIEPIDVGRTSLATEPRPIARLPFP